MCCRSALECRPTTAFRESPRPPKHRRTSNLNAVYLEVMSQLVVVPDQPLGRRVGVIQPGATVGEVPEVPAGIEYRTRVQGIAFMPPRCWSSRSSTRASRQSAGRHRCRQYRPQGTGQSAVPAPRDLFRRVRRGAGDSEGLVAGSSLACRLGDGDCGRCGCLGDLCADRVAGVRSHAPRANSGHVTGHRVSAEFSSRTVVQKRVLRRCWPLVSAWAGVRGSDLLMTEVRPGVFRCGRRRFGAGGILCIGLRRAEVP